MPGAARPRGVGIAALAQRAGLVHGRRPELHPSVEAKPIAPSFGLSGKSTGANRTGASANLGATPQH